MDIKQIGWVSEVCVWGRRRRISLAVQILASQTRLRSTTRIIATSQDGDIPMFISWKEFKHNGFTTALTRWQAGQKDQHTNSPVACIMNARNKHYLRLNAFVILKIYLNVL